MVDRLKYDGIEFPVSVKQYNKIEKQINININVFGYENNQFYPIYVSKESNQDMLNILLITEDKNKHLFVLKTLIIWRTIRPNINVKSISACIVFNVLVAKMFYKTNCIVINGQQAIKMPDKDNNILKFQNFHKQMPMPLVIDADFEAITEKYKAVYQIIQNHTQNHIKNILIVVMVRN